MCTLQSYCDYSSNHWMCGGVRLLVKLSAKKERDREVVLDQLY